ncbi:MAG: hypothetical protein RLZZ350_1593 [Verrucomicrobiota bacterium]
MLKAHELFAFMSPALAAEIVDHLHTHEKEIYRATLASVAEVKRVRPIFLERKPRAEQHKELVSMFSRSGANVAALNVLQAWLLKGKTAMLTEFLDALGIKHTKGLVDEIPATMDDAKLKAAIEALLAKYPHETVAVYLRAFNDLNETNWPNLTALMDNDTRLQLGA